MLKQSDCHMEKNSKLHSSLIPDAGGCMHAHGCAQHASDGLNA